MTGKPLLQAPQIQPARSNATGPRRQRGQASTAVSEFRVGHRAAMLAAAATVVNRRRGDTCGKSVTRGGIVAAKRQFAVG